MNSIEPNLRLDRLTPADAAYPQLTGAMFKAVLDDSGADRCGKSVATELAGHRLASIFGSKPWLDVLTATYGFNVKASTCTSGDGTQAAILYSEISDIRGQRVISLPFSDYCDPLVETETDWQKLISPILELQMPVRFRTVFNDIPLKDERFSRQVCALWHGVDLTRSEEELWGNLKDTARRNIRRAQKHGITIRQGSALDDVKTFYRLHCHVRKSKYRLLAQPFPFFENIHANFVPDDNISVLLAELDGVAIAGILFLVQGNTLYYKFNASIDLEFRPNDLLAWSGILLGRRRGLARLDFGLSDLEQPGLIAFKRKFATQERDITQLLWSPSGYASPCAQATGEVLGSLTKILTEPEVPDSVARASSDLLYRFFC
jgi:Acetyltransferase (GNAT) domain